MRRYFSVFLLSLLPLLSQAASPQPDPTASLRRFFSEVHSYQARFNQVVLDEGLNIVQESSGTLWISRPNRFRWDYDLPFKQQIVADGSRIWVPTRNSSRQPSGRSAAASATRRAMLLAGHGKLDDNFKIKSLGTQGKLAWAQLAPKRKDGGFEDIRIGFEQGRLRMLEMVDGFGQTTRVTRAGARKTPKLTPPGSASRRPRAWTWSVSKLATAAF